MKTKQYRVLCARISNDKTGEEYHQGEETDLEGWPKQVIKSWLERGRIEEVTKEASDE